MSAVEKAIKSEPRTLTPRLKFVERDCPRCDAIITKNEREDCYECPKCGFIDCGTEKEHKLSVAR